MKIQANIYRGRGSGPKQLTLFEALSEGHRKTRLVVYDPLTSQVV